MQDGDKDIAVFRKPGGGKVIVIDVPDEETKQRILERFGVEKSPFVKPRKNND